MKLLVVLLILCPWVDTMRVLSVFPSPTMSHYLSGRRIMLELLKRGHEVVCISPYDEGPRENYTWIKVEVKSIFDAVPNLKEEFGKDYTFTGYLNYVWRTMNAYVNYIVRRPKLSKFIRNDTSKFDLIFAHDFFQPIFYAFAHKYNAPLVVISSFGHSHYIQRYTGGHFDFTIPHEFSNLEHPLNCFNVIKNCFYILYDIFGRKVNLFEYQNELVPDVFGIHNLDLEDLERNIDLVLINAYHTTSGTRATLPNVIEVGGEHIEEAKPLSKNLQEILDEADHGVILLSLGSIIDLSQNEGLVSSFVTVLGGLKQRVIVKYDSNATFEMYNNVYTFPFLPQNDILAHPNLKLFITHGGALSSHEAVYHGIPTICIPFQANQHQVCHHSAKLGYAIRLPKDQVESRLNDSIQKILANDSFKKNALKASRRFRDRPISGLDAAVFWIEFCSRNRRGLKAFDNKSCYVIELFSSVLFVTLSIILVIKRYIFVK